MALLEDSLVAKESGRGMNSNVSENPTLARLESLSGEGGCETRDFELTVASSVVGNEERLYSTSEGLVGALLLPTGGFNIMERS